MSLKRRINHRTQFSVETRTRNGTAAAAVLMGGVEGENDVIFSLNTLVVAKIVIQTRARATTTPLDVCVPDR